MLKLTSVHVAKKRVHKTEGAMTGSEKPDDTTKSHKETKDEQEVLDYWTERRMSEAKPRPIKKSKRRNAADTSDEEPPAEKPITEDEASD